MLISLAESHFGSLSQNVSEVKLHNMYLAANPLSANGYSYVTRPVVSVVSDQLPGVVRGVFYQQGFGNDLMLAILGNSAYFVGDDGTHELVGNVPGTSTCRFASTIFHTAVVSDDKLYLIDNETVIPVETPDGDLVTNVASLDNYFIVTLQASNKFYWIKPGETTIDALDFASAEANADNIVSIETVSDELWLIGTQTTEVWASSGDADAPFVRISGRIYNMGCSDVESVTVGINQYLPCVMWVSDQREVILAQGQPNKISNDFVEEVLRRSTVAYGWFFRRNRNDFYVLSTDVMSLVFDLSTGKWYKWSTQGSEQWLPNKGVQKGDSVFAFTLLASNTLMKLVEGNNDTGTDSLVCEVTGFVHYAGRNSVPCTSVDIVTNSGFGDVYGRPPIVELRWSDDQGANWSTYLQTNTGDRGQTYQQVQFRSLGVIRTPGRRFEIRFSSNESFRLDYAFMNGTDE